MYAYATPSCMKACMHVRSVYMSTNDISLVCESMCVYAWMYVCMYACMHACMHGCMYVCMYNVCTHVCVRSGCTLTLCMWVYFYHQVMSHFVHLHMRSIMCIHVHVHKKHKSKLQDNVGHVNSSGLAYTNSA